MDLPKDVCIMLLPKLGVLVLLIIWPGMALPLPLPLPRWPEPDFLR